MKTEIRKYHANPFEDVKKVLIYKTMEKSKDWSALLFTILRVYLFIYMKWKRLRKDILM